MNKTIVDNLTNYNQYIGKYIVTKKNIIAMIVEITKTLKSVYIEKLMACEEETNSYIETRCICYNAKKNLIYLKKGNFHNSKFPFLDIKKINIKFNEKDVNIKFNEKDVYIKFNTYRNYNIARTNKLKFIDLDKLKGITHVQINNKRKRKNYSRIVQIKDHFLYL